MCESNAVRSQGDTSLASRLLAVVTEDKPAVGELVDALGLNDGIAELPVCFTGDIQTVSGRIFGGCCTGLLWEATAAGNNKAAAAVFVAGDAAIGDEGVGVEDVFWEVGKAVL